jgi:hypothetical protein
MRRESVSQLRHRTAELRSAGGGERARRHSGALMGDGEATDTDADSLGAAELSP